jgi:hypothetical protein
LVAGGGEGDVVEVSGGGGVEALEVVVGVVADGVSTGEDLAVGVGVFADVVADTEEGGSEAVGVEEVEEAGGDAGMGAVVEGEVNGVVVGGQPPHGAGEEAAVEQRRMFNGVQHGEIGLV